MDEMLALRPETWPLIVLTALCIPEIDVVIVPMLVDRVAVFPWIAVTFASMLVRLVVMVPKVVWIVTTEPLIEVTLAPIAVRLASMLPWVEFIEVTVLLIALSRPVSEVSGSASTVKLANAAGALAPLPDPARYIATTCSPGWNPA